MWPQLILTTTPGRRCRMGPIFQSSRLRAGSAKPTVTPAAGAGAGLQLRQTDPGSRAGLRGLRSWSEWRVHFPT